MFNRFSGKYEPEKDVFIEPSDESIARFREAQLKLDRISNGNEDALAEKMEILAIRFNVKGIEIGTGLDYPDAMTALESIFNETDADLMIKAMEELAKEFGYLPEMDNEEVETEQEMFWFTRESIASLLVRIKDEYDSSTNKDLLKNTIAGGLRTYEINKDNSRPKAKRGEVWKIEIPVGVGRETTGFRWAIVISNSVHAQFSNTVNVIYLDGQPPKIEKSHMEIKNTDLKEGELEKEGRVNITDIFTVDKKRMVECKGKVNDAFMKELMKRIAYQLGM